METSYIKIFSESPIIINRLRSLLDEQHISSLVKNQIESARLAGFGILNDAIDLYIHKTDLQKAMSIVQDFKNEMSS